MKHIEEDNSVLFEGLKGAGVYNTSVLPNQILPESKKNEKWKRSVLDSLEIEAYKQYNENLEFKKLRDMISGKLVYTQVTNKDMDHFYKQAVDLQEETSKKASYLRHWDIIYPILSVFTGEVLLEEDKFRFDTTDGVSTNEYIREKTTRLEKYSQLAFKRELNKILLLQGINQNIAPRSQEELEQQQQQINESIEKFFPTNIQQDMSKNWKTVAAQWAEKTWERDYNRFRLKTLKYLEVKDYLTTGRAPRNHYIGYKTYYPEYWDPIEVFHSKDDDLHNYKDAEYAGRIKFYTPAKLISRYGHYFSQKQTELLGENLYNVVEQLRDYDREGSPNKNVSEYWKTKTVPFAGYDTYKNTLEFQELTGSPTVWEEDLTTGVTRPGYLPKLFNHSGYMSNRLTRSLRQDYIPRTDTIPTLECYFRGFKKVGIITYRTEYGDIRTVPVSEDIEKDVKKELNLKELRSVSEYEYDSMPLHKKENTIIWKYVPVIYLGLKVNLSHIHPKLDDFYLVEQLEYQIRGEKDNLEDVSLPLVGVIDEAPLKKIQSEQMLYNLVLNQNTKYLQKELGGFFAFDVTMFPTEYMGLSDKSKNTLVQFRNFVDKTGLMPLDASKHNMMERGGTQFNTMMYQNVTYTDQIQRNISLAEKYKWQAYEKLGITPTRIGSPSQYQSVEGVKMGQTASFAQTASITHIIEEDQRIKAEVHIAVAQYAQLNNKHENYLFVASDDEVKFLASLEDEWLDIRQIELRPIYSSKKKREHELLKQILLQNNTLGHDAYALSKIAVSDDFLELLDAAKEARTYADKVRMSNHQHEQKLKDKEIQANKEKEALEYKKHTEDNMTKIKVAELKALGDIGDDADSEKATDLVIKQSSYKPHEIEAKKEVEMEKIKKDRDIAADNLRLKLEELELEKEKLNLKDKELETQKYVATVNYSQ